VLSFKNVNPKKVREMLSQSAPTITHDAYSHGHSDMQDGVAKAMEEAPS
jgi:hypothetical protein